jgi:hypothetical protein
MMLDKNESEVAMIEPPIANTFPDLSTICKVNTPGVSAVTLHAIKDPFEYKVE